MISQEKMDTWKKHAVHNFYKSKQAERILGKHEKEKRLRESKKCIEESRACQYTEKYPEKAEEKGD